MPKHQDRIYPATIEATLQKEYSIL